MFTFAAHRESFTALKYLVLLSPHDWFSLQPLLQSCHNSDFSVVTHHCLFFLSYLLTRLFATWVSTTGEPMACRHLLLLQHVDPLSVPHVLILPPVKVKRAGTGVVFHLAATQPYLYYIKVTRDSQFNMSETLWRRCIFTCFLETRLSRFIPIKIIYLNWSV